MPTAFYGTARSTAPSIGAAPSVRAAVRRYSNDSCSRVSKSIFGSHPKSFDTVLVVIDRAGGRSEVEDVIHLAGIKRLTDIRPKKLEAWLVRQVRQVLHPAGQQVMGTDYRTSVRKNRVTQMRAEKASPTGD